MIKDYIEAHSDIKNILLNLKRNNRLTHAYIFSGDNGVGKKEMALFFSSMLYCNNDEPCYNCINCKQIFNHEHPNVYEIAPDGASIKKAQIEALQEEFSKTSLVNGPRIYIIEDADKMNASSANSLLKFIEEPTGVDTYALLLTTDITNMLSTIVSRCGHIHFKSMDKSLLYNLLIDNNVDSESAYIIKEITNSLDNGISMSNSNDFKVVKKLIDTFLDIKNSSDSIKYLRTNVVELSKNDILRMFLEILALLYEDMLYNEPIRFIYLSSKIKLYKSHINMNKIKRDLELILNLRKRLDSNVLAKNIITNLFLELF